MFCMSQQIFFLLSASRSLKHLLLLKHVFGQFLMKQAPYKMSNVFLFKLLKLQRSQKFLLL
eukprot:UN20597